MSAKFDLKDLNKGLLGDEEEQEFETNLQNFDVDKPER